MEKSALQIARAAYQPKLPAGLRGNVKIVEGAPTQSVDNQEEIKALFPNTYGMPLVNFEPTDEKKEYAPINIGIILSGGQAPGGHNVICGLYDGLKKQNPNSKLYGFLMGPGGLVDHNYLEMTDELIDEYRNTGGFDMIGSGRTKLEKEDQFEKGLEIIRKLDISAIVIIGGDDSNTNACVFIPAPLFLYSLSNPIITPTKVAKASRRQIPVTFHSLTRFITVSNISITSRPPYPPYM